MVIILADYNTQEKKETHVSSSKKKISARKLGTYKGQA